VIPSLSRHRPAREIARRLGSSAALLLMLCSCAVQKVHDASNQQLSAGNYEAAIATLEAGYKANPDSTELRTALLQARSEATTRLLTEAGAARAQGRIDMAQALLGRAQTLDPANLRIREVIQAIDVEQRQVLVLNRARELASKGQVSDALRVTGEGLKDNPRQPELLSLSRELERRLRQGRPLGARALAEARPISLDFRDANLRTVLDLVSRNSGVNFVLDKDIRADLRVTIYLRDARLEDALDLITSTNQLSKKVLDEKTILIYPNTPAKLSEYQEQVVRVFYLASAEAKGAAAFLRSMLKLKEPFIDERSNMIALRDSPEMIQLAERLIALYDTSEPEVMLDLEVLEVGSTRLTDLGLKFPDSISLTPLPPGGATGLTIANLRTLTEDRVGVSVAGLLINLKREVGDFEILANPRVRAKNKEKAKILIGNKVPVITTTTSQNGFVAENIGYLDVGLKLDLEPTVYADDDVTIKVALEVSSLAGQIRTANGLIAYEVQTRNASTTLRLRDGETQVLAGLISREQRSTSSRVPGAGDIPVLGRLFSSQLDDGKRSELVLAITPRVVRNVRRLDASEAEIWVGTENQTRLRPLAALLPETPSVGAEGRLPGSLRGAALRPSNPSANPGAGAMAGGSTTAGQPNASSSQGLAPSLRMEAPAQVKVGQEFAVMVMVNAPSALRGLSLEVRGDEQLASAYDVSAGQFFSRDGMAANASRAPSEGGVRVSVLRQQASGVAGGGVAAMVRFKALRAGRLELSMPLAEATLSELAGGAPISASPAASLVVEIQP
jgi:general secretion pathway protein D